MPDYLHRAEPAYGSMARDELALDEELAAERPIFKPMRLRARDAKKTRGKPGYTHPNRPAQACVFLHKVGTQKHKLVPLHQAEALAYADHSFEHTRGYDGSVPLWPDHNCIRKIESLKGLPLHAKHSPSFAPIQKNTFNSQG